VLGAGLDKGLGGLSQAAGAEAFHGNYVAASGGHLIQREKKVGQFEIMLLLGVGEREGQVRRIPDCRGSY